MASFSFSDLNESFSDPPQTDDGYKKNYNGYGKVTFSKESMVKTDDGYKLITVTDNKLNIPKKVWPPFWKKAIRLKVVVAGDGGVGKSTWLNRLATGHFAQTEQRNNNFDDYFATLGVSVKQLTFRTNRGPVSFNCWDTAGQERYGGLRDGYYIKGQLGIVMHNYTSQSLRHCLNWQRDLDRVMDATPTVHVGNTLRRLTIHGTTLWTELSQIEMRRARYQWQRCGQNFLDELEKFREERQVPYVSFNSKTCTDAEMSRPFLELARMYFDDPTLVFEVSPQDSLQSLISQQEWGKANELLQQELQQEEYLSEWSEEEKQELHGEKLLQTFLSVPTRNDVLLPHYICEHGGDGFFHTKINDTPPSLIDERAEQHLQFVTRIFQTCPEQAMIRNRDGDLPLHLAAKNQAPLAIIEVLLAVNPEAASMRNDEGELPLHCLLKHFSRFQIGDRVRIVGPTDASIPIETNIGVVESFVDDNKCCDDGYYCGKCHLHVVQYPVKYSIRLDSTYDVESSCNVEVFPFDLVRYNETTHPSWKQDIFYTSHQKYFFQKACAVMDCFPDALSRMDKSCAVPLQLAAAKNVPVELMSALISRSSPWCAGTMYEILSEEEMKKKLEILTKCEKWETFGGFKRWPSKIPKEFRTRQSVPQKEIMPRPAILSSLKSHKVVVLGQRYLDHHAFVEFLLCNKRLFNRDQDAISMIRHLLLGT